MSVEKNTYELTYIVNPVISDDQIKELVNRTSSYITESGGEIIHSDEWGTRRLAFPIQKKRNGYYVNLVFHASGSIIARLERALEIDDNILRYLTLRLDAKMIRHFEARKSTRSELAAPEKDEKADRSAKKAVAAAVEKAKAESDEKESAAKDKPVESDAIADVPEEAPNAEAPVAEVVDEAPETAAAETAPEAVADETAPEAVAAESAPEAEVADSPEAGDSGADVTGEAESAADVAPEPEPAEAASEAPEKTEA